MRLLTDAEIEKHYGKPGDLSNIVTIKLPYTFRYVVAPGKFTDVTKMQCHKKVAPRFTAVFNDILTHYGYEKIKTLGIDFYAGCLNVRLQRGSKTKWSRHSWGIAVDLDPLRNGLKTKWKDAQFAKPEYKAMVDIFHKHGFIGYGPGRGYDAMHWEIGELI